MSRSLSLSLAFAIGLCSAQPALAFNVYTVGADAACGYATVQAAVDAAAANPGEDYVWIANNSIYSGQHIVINNQDVIIEGGFTDCSQNEPTGTTTLRSTTSRVFDIEGNSNVELAYLGIVGFVGDTEYGGGIYFNATGSLTLIQSTVLNGEAGYGGGIAMNPTSHSLLSLQHSYVAANVAAHDGGGLWLRDTDFSSDSSSQIFGNSTTDTAGGRGGGAFLGGPLTAYINSSIHNNSAGWGAGFYTYGEVALNLYTTDTNSRVSLFANSATNAGGGAYLYARTTAASLCARDFSIESNTAHDGAAFQTDGPFVDAHLNDTLASCQGSVPAVACPAGPHCNDISHNISQQTDGTPTGGSTVVIGTQGNTGNVHANRFLARQNQAGAFAYINYNQAPASGQLFAEFTNCLIADNTNAYYTIWASGGSANTVLGIFDCTIANNTEGSGAVIRGGASFFDLEDSIVANGDGAANYNYTGSVVDAYNLFSASQSGSSNDTIGLASFVDPANGDYHLVPTSIGVDYAPGFSDVDLDGKPRTLDLPDVPNTYGPMDLGAYEVQSDACTASDTIFCNGFDGQ
jgi:hypothetical protein